MGTRQDLHKVPLKPAGLLVGRAAAGVGLEAGPAWNTLPLLTDAFESTDARGT